MYCAGTGLQKIFDKKSIRIYENSIINKNKNSNGINANKKIHFQLKLHS